MTALGDPARLTLRRLDLRTPDAATDRERDALCRRGAVPDPAVRDAARAILADVRERGADAVREAAARFGGGRPDGRLLIDRTELRAAVDRLSATDRAALETAIANVRRFAESQRPVTTRTTIVEGVELERRWLPVRRAGVYAPGGSAPYPSSLVMGVVPAMVAGVDTIVVASPADRDGNVHPVLLGAAGLLDVDALLVAGGVQAIGALAYGLPTEGLAPVDLVVGPGSAWVTAAKLEIAGEVGIDLPAGPSEGLVLADATADARTVAADLVTQAEHGPDSPALLVTPDEALADAVEAEVRRRLATASRRDILARALGDHGRIVLVPDLDAGIAFVNDYGPEHLSVDVADARAHRRPDPQRRLDLRRPLEPGERRRLRVRREPRPAHGRARARVRSARGRDVRQVQPGPADHARGPRRRSGPPSAPSPRPRACSRTGTPWRRASATRLRRPPSPRPPLRRPPDEPEPVRGDLAHRSRLVQLGGDRRGRCRAIRDPGLAGAAIRPQHVARAPGDARRPARRQSVRDDALGVPARRLPPARRGGRGPLRRRVRRGRAGRRRGRDPRHVHEGVPARPARRR